MQEEGFSEGMEEEKAAKNRKEVKKNLEQSRRKRMGEEQTSCVT
jgi:hypothetical protein